MPGCGHAKLCDDEILKRVKRWLEKSEWTLTGVLLNTDGTKGVDVSFGIIFLHDLWKRDEKGVSFLQKLVNRPCAQGKPVVITTIDLRNAARNPVAQRVLKEWEDSMKKGATNFHLKKKPNLRRG